MDRNLEDLQTVTIYLSQQCCLPVSLPLTEVKQNENRTKWGSLAQSIGACSHLPNHSTQPSMTLGPDTTEKTNPWETGKFQ